MTTTTTTIRHRSRGRRGGFTLMEVLAALLLLAIVLPVAMDGIGRGIEAGSAAKRRAEGAVLAEGKLNETIAMGAANMVEGAGEFGPEWPGYKWTVRIGTSNMVGSSGDSLGLLEVAVEVTWPERGTEKTLRLTSLVLDETAITPVGTGAGGGL